MENFNLVVSSFWFIRTVSLFLYLLCFLDFPLREYPTHKYHLPTRLPALSQSYSNYNPQLYAFTSIFFIRLNGNNDLICCVPIFPPSLRENWLGGLAFFDIIFISYIGLSFDLAYQTYKNFCTSIFLLEYLSHGIFDGCGKLRICWIIGHAS